MKWLTGLRLPRWTGIAVPVIDFPAVHALLVWALSLLAVRHGWVAERPGILNFTGLIPVGAIATSEHGALYNTATCWRDPSVRL